ncbi:hypothetical protein EII17_08425 [Clostridiales bacterium COT073_COT-073]|nr:hypothetical protein EII17_08425 [Clostridiales bacterium COT073_COT-073]
MIQIHLDIKDKEYQAALAAGLALMNGGRREIYVHHFTDPAERKNTWQKLNLPNSLWLISADGVIADELPDRVLLMKETPTEAADECFCYQALAQIQKQITERLYAYQMVEKSLPAADETRCIYLYSPFGGIGISNLAYQLAKRLSVKHKVLLLSLDAYHTYNTEFIPFRLSEFLFYWQTLSRANVTDFCQKNGNLDILHGPHSPEDLAVLKAQSKADFLQALRPAGYTDIVFDLSSSGMEFWCRPEERYEFFFVVKRLADKWKQFAAAADFEYTVVSEEQALAEICRQLEGGKNADRILSPDH